MLRPSVTQVADWKKTGKPTQFAPRGVALYYTAVQCAAAYRYVNGPLLDNRAETEHEHD